MMQTLADHSIRRALSFAGLGVATLMLALSYDPVLSLRTGGNLLGLVCLILLLAAWRAPRRNMRRSELWSLMLEHAAALAQSLSAPEAQKMMSATLRARLVWHADAVGIAALVLWAVSLGLGLVLD
ncbi:hypothetical protein [Falsiroseomonas sp. E2-1-a20]|uniref:hypothetical protein n=1 Tax=Falsiroseomonas sp. E2-1-a20 TaxID=3239300 RepID=UPI003F2F41B6